MNDNMPVKAFYSDTPPPRIIGSECEYDVQETRGLRADSGLMTALSKMALIRAGYESYNGFLSNGGRVYHDCGHVEYATPEAKGAKEATEADLAGIQVITHILESSGIRYEGIFRHGGEYLPKNCVFPDTENENDVSHGYHENYLMPRRSTEDNKQLRNLLAAHLSTRLYAWGGTVRSQFVLSQKIWGTGDEPVIYERNRLTKHGSKPMVIIPSSVYDADKLGKDWSRVEVRFADPTTSPVAKYLGFATTSMALRLVEHAEKVETVDLEKIALKNASIAAHEVARDLTFDKNVLLANGTTSTAVNIQEMLLAAAYDLSQKIELPEDELEVLPIWEKALDSLRAANLEKGEYQDLAEYVDWAALHKLLTLRGYSPAELNNYNDEVMLAVLMWNRISPDGIASKWWAHHKADIISTENVNRLVLNPPLGGRAETRANLIWDNHKQIIEAGWGFVGLQSKLSQFLIHMADPYSKSYRSEEADL